MKVKATWHHTFGVTRDVEVDEEGFRQWASYRYGDPYDVELALAAWISEQDTDLMADVFHDWRTSEPLPRDFELLWSDVNDCSKRSE